MKKEKEKIDLLLERNASEQLAGVNWGGLHAAISERLNQVQQSKTYGTRFPAILKIAAGVAAAAAIIIIAVMFWMDTPKAVRLENGPGAVVKFVEGKGSAEVEILDSKGQNNQIGNRSAWIIIRTREPEVADNGQSRDEADFACLM
jgi:hypothetical protein